MKPPNSTITATTHTPGPWEIAWTYDDCGKSSEISGHGRELQEAICIIPHDDVTEESEPEMKANARLIAAAPELLEACQRMATGASRTRADYPDDELFKHTMHYLKALDAAISKAEGENQ